MPRRLLGIFLLLLVSVSVMQAQGDAVLFTVGSEAVSRDEFVHHLGKSPEERADVFVETYARFKQKVLYARELGLDTLPDYLRQVEAYREASKGKWANDISSGHQEREWVRLVHFTYPLRQSASKQEQHRGMVSMDSLYLVLKKGIDAPIGESSWVQVRYLLNEWKAQLAGLAKDEYSKPFYSPLGIHVIAWTDRKMKDVADGRKALPGELPLMCEMQEALLVLALDNHWHKALVCTESELKGHFKEHRADYGGGIPHFKGAVIHCQSKKIAKAIKKCLKKYPQALWKEAIGRLPEEMSKGCCMDVGLYEIGENPYVDKLAFGCGDFNPLPDFPYTWVLGKKLKDGPTDYRDVRGKVEKDCFEVKKKNEMEALAQKYRVEIDKEVLKTVNCAVNK